MIVYTGAETINTPNGNIDQCSALISNNISGVAPLSNKGFKGESFCFSQFKNNPVAFNDLALTTLQECLAQVAEHIITSEKALIIISSTKGDLSAGFEKALINPANYLQKKLNLKHFPLIISNACASGVMAINTAASLIRNRFYDHVCVLGIDLIHEFITYGFQSLFALSNEPCKPFDKNRNGINLGEGAAAVMLSSEQSIFKTNPIQYLNGSSCNDANHISGPSRSGEGLYRSVKHTLKLADMNSEDIDFISAHGTATIYNDEMEAVAFNRLQMNHIPLNSFKGFFGHTLGAAGIIETAMCMDAIRKNKLLPSVGFSQPGTTENLNIITTTQTTSVNRILKTASGFGGCNASLILQKI
jgi:3-oxoacyl-[acyl-carrier-protein] synthase-1